MRNQGIQEDLPLKQLSREQSRVILQAICEQGCEADCSQEDMLAKLESILEAMFKAEELREEVVMWDPKSSDKEENIAVRVWNVLLLSYEVSYWWYRHAAV